MTKMLRTFLSFFITQFNFLLPVQQRVTTLALSLTRLRSFTIKKSTNSILVITVNRINR